jgi:hypothetical protein
MRIRLLLLIILFFCQSLLSQDKFELKYTALFQNSQLDTTKLLSDTPLKSPWGAVLRSAVIPGWGQLYTEEYVKAGLALTINGFFLYQIYHYEMKWRDTKKQDYREKRNDYTWYFAISYLLTLVDAYINAYLYKFDEAMEISQNLDRRESHWSIKLNFSFHF